jgi:hypothetical protein
VDNNNTLKYIQYEENLINIIICNIFSINSIGKYTLRRLKYLHSLFPNLGERHFNNIFNNIINGDINILTKILKYYYYQPFTNNNISKLLSFVNNNDSFNYFYSLLKTNTEKNKFIISSLLLYGTAYNINIIDGFNDFNNLKEVIIENVKLVLMDHSYKKININEFNKFINNIGFANVSSCLIIDNSFYVKKHKQSHGIKSLENGEVILILTNRNMVWLNRNFFPLVKSKQYKKELKEAIQERFPEFKKLFHGKKLVFSLANNSDQRFEWSQK